MIELKRKKSWRQEFKGINAYNYGDISVNIKDVIHVLKIAKKAGAKVVNITTGSEDDCLAIQPAVEELESDKEYICRLKSIKGKLKEEALEIVKYLELKEKYKKLT